MSEKFKNKKTIIIIITVIALMVGVAVYNLIFAAVQVGQGQDINGDYITFELDHNITNAQYKYYGYGYTVSVALPGGHVIHTEYMENSEFEPFMDGGKEKVKIYTKTLYKKIGLALKYFSMSDLTIYLNGRLGIKKDEVVTHAYDSYNGSPAPGMPRLDYGTIKLDGRTVPLNKDSMGIVDGIYHEYGVNWTGATEKNLEQHFGIALYFPNPAITWDRYEVEYREIGTDKTVNSPKELQEFTSAATITEYPETVNGYEYRGFYKIDTLDTHGDTTKGNVVEGDSATLNIRQNANIYTIVFYYEKLDPSQIGKPVTIDVEYREKTSTGNKLINNKSFLSGERAVFNLSSEKIDNYTCKGYYVIGQSTEYFYDTNANFTIGKENYSKAVNGTLKIIFIYEKVPYVSIPKCSPDVSGEANTINISMKKKDFETAIDISVKNTQLKIDNFEGGKDKNGNVVEGTHDFKFFDLYIGNSNYYYMSYDNFSKTINATFNVPKNIFSQSPTDTNLYTADIDVIYAAFCTCYDGKPDNNKNYGMEIDNGNIRVNITLIENKPPVADFIYYTEKKLLDGSIDEIGKAFKGQETIINNQANDPNGLLDIHHIKYTLKDSKSNEYFAKLLMLQDGSYILESDNISANNVEMLGASDNGNIKVKFKEKETWIVSQFVQDIEGLSDTYSTDIVVQELNLKPMAVLNDSIEYRFPKEVKFNGKQNRVVAFNSNSSYVAEFLEGTGVEINHNRDTLEIEPLDGQSLDSIKFENDYNVQIIDNKLQIKYTPINNIKMMFIEAGKYNIRLQVTDTNGNVSDFTDNRITINKDLSPIITANANPKYYRNTSKNAIMTFNALASSSDLDIALINSISYKFDSDNDNSFEDEAIQTGVTHKDINIDGVIYKQISLSTNKVGKYQFIIDVKESFGQETINKYINIEDYKTANINIITEVDNIAPVATLGLQKNNNIDVKILTSGLTGTRNQDVQNNLSNLKTWLKSENNIKVGNIEILNLSNEVNGLLSENALTWKKVTFTGSKYSDDEYFKYKEIRSTIDLPWSESIDPEKPLAGYWYDILPNGLYADGWNGIPVPKLYAGVNIGGWNLDTIKYKHVTEQLPNSGFWLVEKNAFLLDFNASRVRMGYLNGRMSIWGDLYIYASMFSAVSEEKIKDFDISFSFNVRTWEYADARDVGNPMFMWNVKDKNNYFAYVESYEKRSSIPIGEIIQVRNNVPTVLKTFYYGYDSESDEDVYTNVTRIKQVGNSIQAYSASDILLFEYKASGSDVGGHFGLSAYDGYCMNDLTLNIYSLKYVEDSNMYGAIDKLQWGKDTDKYLINLVEGTKLEELNNTYSFNRTLGKLQEKEINLINIGVNSVNGIKLKSLVAKNSNNGTFIEIGNIYDNFTVAANYISNKYDGILDIGQYILLGDIIDNTENYHDTENDVKLHSNFRYVHTATYFDNNLGIINNNNAWTSEPITTFNKTGKYVLNYRVKDNPLYPDINELNPFGNYRKYSDIFSRDIFVHRKPVSNFTLGAIGKNAWTNVSISEDFVDSVFNIQPTGGGNWSLSSEVWYIHSDETATVNISVPADAVDIKLSFRADRVKKGYASISIGSIGVSIPSWYGGKELSYYLNPGNTVLTVRASSTANILLDSIVLTYSIPNETVSIPINDNSYDMDHTSRADKGITEWQWKIIDKNSNISTQTFTNKASGLSWVRNNIQSNGKWVDSSIQLRVKDIEGTWSNWSGKFIDGKSSVDGGDNSGTIIKPIADFLIDKNPLIINSESQIITNTSYDPSGLALNYIWTIRKDNIILFTSTQNDISSTLNSHIITNGIGIYEISLIANNSSGVYSDIVTKSFNVIVYNYPPNADFDLVSNESPAWIFPKALGLYTLKYRPLNTLFYEEKAKFNVNISDPNTDNTGFVYNWKIERYAVKDISNVAGVANNSYSYTTQYPFTNSFKNQGLSWGAYKITLNVMDKPPIPPFTNTDSKSTEVIKYYYVIPEISLTGSFESTKTEVIVGDAIKLKATTSNLVESVKCTLNGTFYTLSKKSEDGGYIYWERDLTIPDNIESGTHNLQFVGSTTYGGNGNVTREIRDTVSLDIIALKLINLRITDIVNHPFVAFPQTKDMLMAELIKYKTGYYVTFRIDSKGKPDNVNGRIDIGNNGSTDQVINLTKVASGDTETWQGRFYTSAYLPVNTVISIKLDCSKGAVTYDYNMKENWDGRSLITNGSALMDGRVNLTN